jgi:hypothetical protein
VRALLDGLIRGVLLAAIVVQVLIMVDALAPELHIHYQAMRSLLWLRWAVRYGGWWLRSRARAFV